MQIEVRPLGKGLISVTPEERFAHSIKDLLEKELGCEVTLFLEQATGRAIDNPSQAPLQTIKYISYIEASHPVAMTVKQIAFQICKRLQGSLSHSGDNFYIELP